MNHTQLEHALFGMVLQVTLAYWLGWWAAGAVAVALFFGREYAQVEYRIQARTGRSLTDMMPWHVLRPSEWTLDGVLDVVGVAIGCTLLAVLFQSL